MAMKLKIPFPERLLNHKYNNNHNNNNNIGVVVVVMTTLLLAASLISLFLLVVAPRLRLLTLLHYFWPLIVSTALFLSAVAVFGRTSPPALPGEETPGELLLDYVAGQSHLSLHHPDLQSDGNPDNAAQPAVISS